MSEWLEMEFSGYYCHLFHLYLTIKSMHNTEGFGLGIPFKTKSSVNELKTNLSPHESKKFYVKCLRSR